jgi:hypothetical protein
MDMYRGLGKVKHQEFAMASGEMSERELLFVQKQGDFRKKQREDRSNCEKAPEIGYF